MLTKSLLRLSVPFGRSINTTQRILAYHLSHVGNTEDDTKNSKRRLTNKGDLLDELNVMSPTKILVLLEKNASKIDGSHIVVALNSFLKVQKKNIKVINGTEQIQSENSKLHRQVSDLLFANIDKASGSQCVQILDLLCRMKVEPSSEVIECVLRRITRCVNDLLLTDYSLLSSLLMKMPKTDLNMELRHSLKRTFVYKISMDFEDSNLTHIQQGLSFVSHNLKDSKLLEFFLNKLQMYNKEIPYKTSIIILESLCHMDRYPFGWLNVLHKVYNSITEHMDELNESEIKYIILMIAAVEKTQHVAEFYNGVLIDKLIQRLIDNDVGLENALSVLKNLKNLRHLNKELINYACACYFERTSLIGGKIQDHTGKLLVLISALAAANHKTIFWKEIEDNIMNNDAWLRYDYKTLCILALNLMCLDCCPIRILEKVFDNKYDYSGEVFLHWTFCKIYQKIKCIPNYDGPLPDESCIKSLETLHQNTCRAKEKSLYYLLVHLEEGMGGPVYVKSNVSTKLFHLIDHVVAFQEDGTPIPMNSNTNIEGTSDSIEFIEDLQIPPGSKVVLLLLLPQFWYFRNTNQLMGVFKTTVDTLAKSHTVIPIHEGVWKSLPDGDKKTYLMNEIQAKISK